MTRQRRMNPDWTRDEVLLVYDLYLRYSRSTLSVQHPAVRALSQELRGLPWHVGAYQDAQFRNPAGVVAKLRQLHDYGLERSPSSISLIVQSVALEYRHQPDEVHRLAKQIRALLGDLVASEKGELLEDALEFDQGFPEGRVIQSVHQRRERRPQLVARKLADVKWRTGRLACESCGFDFQAMYGALGEGYAECHHTRPLSEGGLRQTRLEDLAVVCANCHAMIHHRRPWRSVAALRAIIDQQRAGQSRD